MNVEVSPLIDDRGADWTADRRVEVLQNLFVNFLVVSIVLLKRALSI
jgi:hypothetical protein